MRDTVAVPLIEVGSHFFVIPYYYSHIAARLGKVSEVESHTDLKL
jgi:hypothetical protein